MMAQGVVLRKRTQMERRVRGVHLGVFMGSAPGRDRRKQGWLGESRSMICG